MKIIRDSYVLRMMALVTLALVFPMAQPQAAFGQQWNTNGNDISNANSGNVGIGTTTPVSALHVATESTAVPRGITNSQHSSDGNSPLLIFRKTRGTKLSPLAVINADGLGNLQSQGYDGSSYITTARFKFAVDGTVSSGSVPTSIQFFTGSNASGIERMRISSSGNVGIGTTNPLDAFHLFSTANSVGTMRIQGGNTYAGYVGMWDGGPSLLLSNNRHPGTGANFNTGTAGALITLGTLTTPSDIMFSTTSNGMNGMTLELMRIKSTGNVGIGTATPSFKLDVQGGQFNASGGLCIAGDCKTAWSQVGGSSQWTTSGSNIYFNTGNVGIGTTSPAYSLDVTGGANGFRVKTSSVSANDAIANFENPSGIQGIMRANGNFGLGSSSPAVRLAVNGNGVNVYNTDAWIENNIHVQGNETLAQGGRGRLRVGTAWGYMGLYSEISSTGVQNDLVLGAGTGNVRVGPGAAIAQNFLVPNGNVGIGTASPVSSRLHLYSPSNTYLRIGAPLASQSAIAFNDDTNGQDIVLYRPENSRNFSIWTAQSSIVMTVTQPGSVGLGTTTPGFKFDVQGGQINSSGGLCIAGDCKTAWSEVGGNSQWTTAGSAIHYNTGNVGIGTTAPANKLHVAGGTRVDGGNGRVYLGTTAPINARGLEIIEENATTFSLRHHDPNVAWQNIAINPHGGNVGVGTLSPSTKLHVAGDGRVTGNLTVDGNIAAKYQDLAEWVPATRALPPGTVVTLNPSQSNLVEASSKAYDTRVAGVISAQPGIALGEKGENKILVATTGRVRIKVDATRHPIAVGDLLVTSDKEGVAMKSLPVKIGGVEIHRPGTIIGKALEPLARGQGEILVLLSLQ